MGLLWVCRGSAVALLWVCCGFAVGLLWVCCGSAVGLLWVCCGFAVGLLWVCCGLAVGLLWDCLFLVIYNKTTHRDMSSYCVGKGLVVSASVRLVSIWLHVRAQLQQMIALPVHLLRQVQLAELEMS